MARKTKTADNSDLEHTRGGVTTRDGMDAGVPMTPGQPDEPIGPEDALGPGLKRGHYKDRINQGPHMRTRAIPADERAQRAEGTAGGIGDVPEFELVPADDSVDLVGDEPGKGGVSTASALEENTAPVGDGPAPGDTP